MYICEFCGEQFEKRNSLGCHKRWNKVCHQKMIEKIDNDDRPKIECKICGKKLRNVSNTHLKTHNMTSKEYIEKYGHCIFSDGLLEIQRKNRDNTINEKYSEEERWKFRSQGNWSQGKQTHVKNFEESKKIRKEKQFINNLFKNNKEEWKRLVDEKRKKTCLERYGVKSHTGLKSVLEKREKTQIEKYGSLEKARHLAALKGVNTRIKKGILNWCPIYSLDSQELFIALEKIYKDNEIYYATNGTKYKNNEYKVCVYNKKHPKKHILRCLDYYDKTLNKCIEYDEEYHSSEQQLKEDLIRESEIKEKINGIQFLRITRTEWKNNKEKTLQKCKEFLI